MFWKLFLPQPGFDFYKYWWWVFAWSLEVFYTYIYLHFTVLLASLFIAETSSITSRNQGKCQDVWRAKKWWWEKKATILGGDLSILRQFEDDQ